MFDKTTAVAAVLDAVRSEAPLIHNLTNNVVQNDTADAIAAIGAVQATVHNVEEARELAAIASAVSINLGTPSEIWTEAARLAASVAVEMGKPWVLDPVAVGLLPYRTALAAEFLALGPTVVKGNASEIMALAGEAAKTHGADSQHDPEQAADAAIRLAGETGAVVAATGPVDLVTDGVQALRIQNGHPLMPRVIGTGCMLTPLVAACIAVSDDARGAVVAALAAYGVAGEIAAEQASGPGTMKPLLIDALAALTGAEAAARAAVA